MLRKTFLPLIIPLFLLNAAIAFASKPMLDTPRGFNKQSLQLNQIIPRASKQKYGHVTVYSTVGMVSQFTLMRWSFTPDLWADIFVNRQKWWWVEQIPRPFTVIIVSEAEFKQFWPWVKDSAGGIFNYPNEVWLKEFNAQKDMPVIHEILHKDLAWIYVPNYPASPNTRLPGYSPLIIVGGEILANQLNDELGFNPDPIIFNPQRFNRMWEKAKTLMLGQGFIGVENVPTPRVVNCRQNCAWQITDVNIKEYEGWQRYNGTGEIYLSIIMLTQILHYYNDHQDNTGIFDLAVCNAKRYFNQLIGPNPGENSFIVFQGQFISCER